MNNRIYLSLLIFLATTGAAHAQNTLPKWEKDSGWTGVRDNVYGIDDDNFGNESRDEGSINSTWLTFGRIANNVSASWTCYRWDRDPRRIGFISTEDVYHDYLPGFYQANGNKRFERMYLGYIDVSDPDNISSRTRTNILTINKDLRVGINTSNLLAALEIKGGARLDGSDDPKAMAFQYKDGGYRHWIRTRHNSVSNYTSGNAIDFYLNKSATADGSSAPGIGSTLGMSITAAGVGIGTTDPGNKLEVASNGSRSGSGITIDGSNPIIHSTLVVNNSGNSTTTDYYGAFGIARWYGDNGVYKYPFLDIRSGSTTNVAVPIIMEVNDRATMQIFQHQVLIGSDLAFPASDGLIPWSGIDYTLGVRGRVVSSGITCKNLNQWADFVFDENYSLKPLDEVADYVATHKHLPDIPSAKEVTEKGIDVSEMLKLQMQKIEELTLYTIRRQKLLKKQQEQIAELQAQLSNN